MKIAASTSLLVATATLATTSVSASDGETPSVIGPSYRFADYDGDGALDVYVVDPLGGDRLFHNDTSGAFVDVTERAGVDAPAGSRLALWRDYDGDGALDLYVGCYGGAGRLYRNMRDGTFADVTRFAGLTFDLGAQLDAEWIDVDGDGRPDLHVVAESGDRLWRNLGDGRFELVDLPHLRGARVAAGLAPQTLSGGASSSGTLASFATGPAAATGVGAGAHSSTSSPHGICAGTLIDNTTGTCLRADTAPVLGELYPLSIQLNVNASGNVGIGTAAPGAKLDVQGDARASGRLISTAPTGAPIAVSSSALVTNLNADLLDGLHASAFTQLGQTIEGSEISAGTITNANLGAACVSSVKLAAGAVTSASIAAGSVGSSALAADAVTNAKLQDGAVTTAKLALSAPLGIGTSAPAADLHVRGSSALGTLLVTPNTVNAQAQVELTENNTATLGMLMRYDGALTNDLQFLGHNTTGIVGPHLSVNRDSGVVKIPGELRAGPGATATPLAYGTINKDGSKLGGSSNWSSSWDSTLTAYKITINGVNYDPALYSVVASPINNFVDFVAPSVMNLTGSPLYLQMATPPPLPLAPHGNIQCGFQFVIYAY